jgi:Glycosyltransferase like family 2
VASRTAFSYVVPLRCSEAGATGRSLAEYLDKVEAWCDDVIVVDGSPAEVFAAHATWWSDHVRHVHPDPAHSCLMGKVTGVLTGVALARHDRVVIADDDVRYDQSALTAVLQGLEQHHLVRPQNFFSPRPWHAVWDTARTLLNRATGADFPGTLAVRRSTLADMGGYDGDVLFENLELIRTVQAHGGAVASPLDLFVRRLPPSAGHFWGQRTRQAYDDFAIPIRMIVWLSVVPALMAAVAARRPVPVVVAGSTVCLGAEAGRRRAQGTDVFPVCSTFLAPAWVLERGVCAWLAVLQRIRFGGVRYGDSVIQVAAHSPRQLRRRVQQRLVADQPGRASADADEEAPTSFPGRQAAAI